MLQTFVLFFIITTVSRAVSRLPWCTPEQSSKGKWISTSSLINSTENLLNFEKYYVGASCKRGLVFSQAWVPSSECSLHRFTKTTLQRTVLAKIEAAKPSSKQPTRTTDGVKRINWLFVGDSALRGIFCGIVHILEGSEHQGPVKNRICGGIDDDYYRGPNPPKQRKPGSKPFVYGALSYLARNSAVEIAYFDTQLVLKFAYTMTLNTDPVLSPLMINSVKAMSRGAWDFDEYARKRKSEGITTVPTDRCEDDITKAIAANRSSNSTIGTLLEMSRIAKSKGVQLIYRNNHYNERFGPLCADEQVEAALNGSHWEIFNNRDISRDVWKKQCPDGFHFARENVYTVQDHDRYAAERFAKDGVYPGQLEMQLAQTLLFQILHSALGAVFFTTLWTGKCNDCGRILDNCQFSIV